MKLDLINHPFKKKHLGSLNTRILTLQFTLLISSIPLDNWLPIVFIEDNK